MSKNKSGGNSETAKIISEEGELDEVAFENLLEGHDPMDFLFGESEEAPAETKKSKAKEVKPEEDEEESEDDEVDETESQEDEAEESEEETEEVETEEEESEDTDEDQDVLSQIDAEQIPEEQRKDVAKAIFAAMSQDQKSEFMREEGSGVGQENGKLRGKLRQAEEEASSLRDQLEKGLSQILPTQNSLSEFKDTESLEKEAERVEGWKNYLDDLLTTKTDEEFEINGQWIQREELAKIKKSYELRANDIPKQRKVLDESSKIAEMKGSEMEAAKKEVSFLADEDSEQFKTWKEETSSPEFALMATAFPKLGAKLARHLARSLAFKAKPKATNVKIPLKAAKAIAGKTKGGSAPQHGSKFNKKALEREKRIKSGEYDDDDLFAGITL